MVDTTGAFLPGTPEAWASPSTSRS